MRRRESESFRRASCADVFASVRRRRSAASAARSGVWRVGRSLALLAPWREAIRMPTDPAITTGSAGRPEQRCHPPRSCTCRHPATLSQPPEPTESTPVPFPSPAEFTLRRRPRAGGRRRRRLSRRRSACLFRRWPLKVSRRCRFGFAGSARWTRRPWSRGGEVLKLPNRVTPRFPCLHTDRRTRCAEAITIASGGGTRATGASPGPRGAGRRGQRRRCIRIRECRRR